jgi:dTDP-glucose 4,6-dehydratase
MTAVSIGRENPLADDLDHVLDHTRELWEDLRGERLFLSGGTGYVGNWLVESLLWANRRLGLNVSATLLSRDPAAYRARVPHLGEAPEIKAIAGAQNDFVYPEGTFAVVVHAATDSQLPATRENPAGFFGHNVEGTMRALEFASTHGAKRFLFTSSGAVYGTHPPEIRNIPEDFAGAPLPCDLSAGYGSSKRASEFLCASYAQAFGFAATIARIYAQAGPYLAIDMNYALGNFIADVLADRPVRITGDGTNYRSYQYSADMTIWLWTILLRGQSSFPYNVGSPDPLTIAELARRVAAVTGHTKPIEILQKARPGQAPARYVPAVDRAAALGLRNHIGLDDSIGRMFRWHRNRLQRQS